MEIHEEDWYWCNPGEVMIEEEFLQDITDDGLFLVSRKEKTNDRTDRREHHS